MKEEIINDNLELRNSFLFYRSFMEAIETIPDELKKAQAYKVIVEYGLDRKEPDINEDLVVKVIFKQAKPQIDASIKRYDNCVKNGKQGGAPKGNKNAMKKTTKEQPRNNQETTNKQPKTTLNYNYNDNDNENYNYNDNERDKLSIKQNEILQNLSQYKNFKIDYKNLIDFDLTNYDFDKIQLAIKNSEFLQKATLSFVLKNYEKVINDYYKSFNSKGSVIINRKYSKADFDAMYTNLDEIDL